MEGRESWIDSWKELLIFLVVLGHVDCRRLSFVSGPTLGVMAWLGERRCHEV